MTGTSTHGFELGERQVLENIARGAPLAELLEQIVRLIEGHGQGLLCSILLVDEQQGSVRHGAAPSLPPEFIQAIDGSKVGPAAGSCGTAVHLRARVIVEDIETHPYWADYRDLALPLGLRACWSSPIFSAEHKVIGTFAVYYREPRAPSEQELEWVDQATHLAAIAISRDAAEHAIRQSEARYRQIVDTAFEGIWLLDSNNCTAFTNRRMEEMLGYAPAEMMGRSVFDFVHDEDRPAAEDHMSRRRRNISELIEFRFRRKDGTALWADVAASPVRDEQGRVVGALGMLTDITDRKAMEATIRRSESLRAVVYNSVADVLFCVAVEPGERFRFVSVNRSFLEATGLSEDRVVGRAVEEVIPQPSIERVLENYKRCIAERRMITWDEESIYPAGTKYGEVSVSPIFDAQGHCTSLVGIVHDVTARRELEQQVIRAQRMDGLGTLAGGVAHDFNNILTAITANVMLVENDLFAGHPAHESLSEISKAAVRATDLVRQILTFSRHEQPKHQVLNLESVATEALKLLRATLPAAIAIEARFEPGAPAVLADPSQIHQVVMNLCTNAAHAMHQRAGILGLRVERVVNTSAFVAGSARLPEGEYARLLVSDTGSGMDKATVERIFDPFFTTKRAGQGTGLGLSVVHGIVKSHGGGISVESSPGEGSLFCLYFPATKVARVEAKPEQPDVLRGRGERVLCLDDEEAIVKGLVRLLEHFGYHAVGHTDPLKALEVFAKDPSQFDVVITDSSMPGISGLDLVRSLLRIRPGLPIAITSGRIDPGDAEALRALGVRELILKPSSMQELCAALHRLLHT
jgi:PAS domain S-box-containing protein